MQATLYIRHASRTTIDASYLIATCCWRFTGWGNWTLWQCITKRQQVQPHNPYIRACARIFFPNKMYPAIPGTYFETTPSDIRGLITNFVYECDKDITTNVYRPNRSFRVLTVLRRDKLIARLVMSKDTRWISGGTPNLPGRIAFSNIITTMLQNPTDYTRMLSESGNVLLEIHDWEIIVSVGVADSSPDALIISLPFCRRIVEGLLDFLTD